MDVTNGMERLVRDEVLRQKAEGTGGIPSCWCSLCETDIVALTLTLLPPFYCRDAACTSAVGPETKRTISDAVRSAIKRVSLRPKHRAGSPDARRGDVGLVNFTYEVGSEMLGPTLGRSMPPCSCGDCRSDVLAYALNRYPPKYGVARSGRRNLHHAYLDYMRFELGMLLTQAVRVVSTHPRH